MIGNGHAGFGRAASEKDPQGHLADVVPRPRHRPRPQPNTSPRAWQAQIRLNDRYRHLTGHGKRSTVANIAVARELAGFLWAAATDQPLKHTITPPAAQKAAA